METTSLEDDLEDDPVIDQDTATQALKGMEETLQPSEASEVFTQDLTGTQRDQTEGQENMATES